jgi:hypothetical protein
MVSRDNSGVYRKKQKIRHDKIIQILANMAHADPPVKLPKLDRKVRRACMVVHTDTHAHAYLSLSSLAVQRVRVERAAD